MKMTDTLASTVVTVKPGPDVDALIERQEALYKRLKDTSEVRAGGLKPGVTPEGVGGYIIAFRPSLEVAIRLSRFATSIAATVPAVAYTAGNMHVTIAIHCPMTPANEFSPDADVLDQLAAGVEKVKDRLHLPLISYGSWLFTETAVIVPGIPDKAFFKTADQVIRGCEDEDLQLESPGGAHLFAAQFTEQRDPASLDAFFALMAKSPKIGVCSPQSIDVGYFRLNANGFELTTHKRFPLYRRTSHIS
jgi:hypothetical protein